MIFLTVGTLFPFDRLVETVDRAVGQGLIEEEVFAQIGTTAFEPRHIRGCVRTLDKSDFDQKVTNASCLISHAGMGSITMALDNGKPLLVMPRLKRFGEHINDHQVGTARNFEKLGHVLAVYDEECFAEKLSQLRTFVPSERKPNLAGVTQRVSAFLEEIQTG